MASRPVEKPAGVPTPGIGSPPPLPAVQIGQPGYKFKFPAESAEGQDERREHERIRKSNKRAAHKASEPPALPTPLPASPVVDALQAPPGEQGPGLSAPGPAMGVEMEPFVPWVAADVCDFTDEIVELAELRRVSEFVEIAREAKLPAKVIAEIEKSSHYPVKSKGNLKRCLGDVVAKALNKTGVSAKNKEEVKLLFCVVTIKLQGVRLKKDMMAMIEADKATKAKAGGGDAPSPEKGAK